MSDTDKWIIIGLLFLLAMSLSSHGDHDSGRHVSPAKHNHRIVEHAEVRPNIVDFSRKESLRAFDLETKKCQVKNDLRASISFIDRELSTLDATSQH